MPEYGPSLVRFESGIVLLGERLTSGSDPELAASTLYEEIIASVDHLGVSRCSFGLSCRGGLFVSGDPVFVAADLKFLTRTRGIFSLGEMFWSLGRQCKSSLAIRCSVSS